MQNRPDSHAMNAWIFCRKRLRAEKKRLSGDQKRKSAHIIETSDKEAIMTRDELNSELRMHSATWPAVLFVYGLLVGALVVSAMSII